MWYCALPQIAGTLLKDDLPPENSLVQMDRGYMRIHATYIL